MKKTIELIKEEFDIKNLETLTETKWCKLKQLIKSNHFQGFYTYYFLAVRGCPWIEPETYDSGFIWQQDGNTTQKLQEALKSQLSYLRIPMRKTYIQKTEFGIALIPHFRSVKRDEIHAAVHILLDSDVQVWYN